MKGTELHFRQLLSSRERTCVQHLVHQIYVFELGWHPPPNNPSGIQMVHRQERPILLDYYDAVVDWYGAWANNQLTTCFRLSSPLNGAFEVERYHPLPAPPSGKSGCPGSHPSRDGQAAWRQPDFFALYEISGGSLTSETVANLCPCQVQQNGQSPCKAGGAESSRQGFSL